MPPANVGSLLAGFLLAQDRHDLLFREPRSLHRPVPFSGRTLTSGGRERGGHIRGAGDEDLAGRYPIAAVDLAGGAGAGDPVGAAAREQDEALGGDAAQQRLDRRHVLVAPAPSGRGDLVGVHGEREGPEHLAELRDVGAAAAELAWHSGLDEARVLEQQVVVGDEGVALVELCGARGEGGR